MEMNRKDVEDLVEHIVDNSARVLKAEISLEFERQANEFKNDLREALAEMKQLVAECGNQDISGMSRESHAIYHMKLKEYLDGKAELKREVVQKVVGYIAIAILSAAVTVYMGDRSSEQHPVIIKELKTFGKNSDEDEEEDDEADHTHTFD